MAFAGLRNAIAKEREVEAISAVEAIGAAGVFSYINVKKANSTAGTYRIGVQTGGTGGVDFDLASGLALSLLGLAVPPKYGTHALAIGVGALANWSARQGGQMALKAQQAAQAAPAAAATTTTSGSLSQSMANGRHYPALIQSRQQFHPQAAGVRYAR